MAHRSVIAVGIFQLLLESVTNAHKYALFCDDEQLFTPCEDAPEKFLWNYFDLSNVTFEFDDEDNVNMNGVLVSQAPLKPTDVLSMELTLFKEVKGQLQDVLTIERPNICAVLFKPSEVWYKFTSKLEGRSRTCPPLPGARYVLNHISTKGATIIIPGAGLEGAYHAKLRMGVVPKEDLLCFNFNFHVLKQI